MTPALDDQIAALVAGLRAAGDERVESEQRAHEHELDALRRRGERSAAVHAALARLRQLTSPEEMLASAAAELCRASDLDRALVSVVRDGELLAHTLHVRDDPAAMPAATPVRLEHPLAEAELLRRGRAAIVSQAAIAGWGTCVAAPIATAGMIHAGRRAGVHAEHRELVWEFACGLALAYETAGLRRALRREREAMRELLEWLNARSRELSRAALELLPSAPPAPLPRRPAAAADRDHLRDLLTRREAEILRLLADGRTNRAIAAELVISPGTVKFHVNRILRKLHVSNRAEAVARYVALLG